MSVNFLKRSLATLIILLVVSPARSPVFAGVFESCRQVIPEGGTLHVSADFDGDFKVDTAFAKFFGSSYRFEVHLSTKRAHVRLSVPVRSDVGLELIAYDVNQDKRADLILTGGSPIKPIAVWLNKGNGSFERGSGLYGPFFGTDGPRLVRGTPRTDGQAVIPTDEPAGDCASESLAFDLETSPIRTCAEQAPPTLSAGGSASPRGPPTHRYL